VRDRRTLWFWTEMGRRMLGLPPGTDTAPGRILPWMTTALDAAQATVRRGDILLGEPVSPRAARHVYESAWRELRPLGFRRARWVEPWPGARLFLPFHRGSSAVVPQGFPARVPAAERLLSLAGRRGAALTLGIDLWVLAARWDGELLEGMERCGLAVLSLDRIGEAFGR